MPRRKPATFWRILKTTVFQYFAHRSPRLGAALAYYSVFSMGPLLLLVIAIAGLFFGDASVRKSLADQFATLLGPSASAALETMLAGAAFKSTDRIAAIIGLALVLLAAVGLVAQLKDAMNTIWNVRDPATVKVSWYVRTYLISFAGVFGLGVLLIISLVFSAAFASLSAWAGGDSAAGGLWRTLSFLVSLGLQTALFAMLFKWFPDTEVGWRDVWLGAALTALLFEVGKQLIGWYVGIAGFETAYGATASLIILLIWVYYSAQILLLGAEFTHAFASETGTRRRQGPDATTPHKIDTEAKS
jgi:membrane protein